MAKERAPSTATASAINAPRKVVGASYSKNASSAEAGHGDKKSDGGAAKVIRDSFTMPVGDYELIGVLKTKCIGLGIAVKKSELLRAGLHALARITDENLSQVVGAVESVKTGRPPGGKKKKKANRAKGKRQ